MRLQVEMIVSCETAPIEALFSALLCMSGTLFFCAMEASESKSEPDTCHVSTDSDEPGPIFLKCATRCAVERLGNAVDSDAVVLHGMQDIGPRAMIGGICVCTSGQMLRGMTTLLGHALP